VGTPEPSCRTTVGGRGGGRRRKGRRRKRRRKKTRKTRYIKTASSKGSMQNMGTTRLVRCNRYQNTKNLHTCSFFPATLTEKNAVYKSNMYHPKLDK